MPTCPHCGGSLSEPRQQLAYGHLSADLLRRQAYVDGREVRLVGKLWSLYVLFLQNPDRVLSPRALGALWRYPPSENSIQKHVSKLRALIGRESIVTVFGAGYALTSHAPRARAGGL